MASPASITNNRSYWFDEVSGGWCPRAHAVPWPVSARDGCSHTSMTCSSIMMVCALLSAGSRPRGRPSCEGGRAIVEGDVAGVGGRVLNG